MDDEDLGGRLRLFDPRALVGPQREVYRQVQEHTVPDAGRAGFSAALPDGRLIGPLNGLLLVPQIAGGFGAWVAAEAEHGGLAEEVRQVVILTVGAAWRAPYELYAHRAAGRAAGLPGTVVDALAAGAEPSGLSEAARAAQRFTRALVIGHDVPDDVYGAAVDAFGEAGLAALVHLVGHYPTISALLVAFRVPAPQGPPRRPHPG